MLTQSLHRLVATSNRLHDDIVFEEICGFQWLQRGGSVLCKIPNHKSILHGFISESKEKMDCGEELGEVWFGALLFPRSHEVSGENQGRTFTRSCRCR